MSAPTGRDRVGRFGDARLAIEAAALVVLIRAAFRILPSEAARRVLRSSAAVRLARGDGDASAAARVGRAVTVAARRLPRTTCLVQALAAESMLRRRGVATMLRIGVRTPQTGQPLDAHAWLECAGTTIVGGDVTLSEYRILGPRGVTDRPPAALPYPLSAALRGEAIQWTDVPLSPDDIVDACTSHGVAYLFYERLRTCADRRDCPAALYDRLAEAAHHSAATELLRRREIVSALDQLGTAGVRPVLIKGTPLAYTVYETPCARPRADSDVLVPLEQVDVARQTLIAHGYASPVYCEGEFLFRQFEVQKTDRFGLTHALDVHWKVSTQTLFADLLTYDELAAEAEPVPALGAHARAASRVHALLLACVHPAMHHRNERRAIWSHDVHRLASAASDEDWRRFVALAVDRQVGAIVAAALRDAAEQWGTAVPPFVVRRLNEASGEPSAEYLAESRRWHHELIANVRHLGGWRRRVVLLREIAFPSSTYIIRSYGLRRGPLTPLILPAVYLHRLARGMVKILAGEK